MEKTRGLLVSQSRDRTIGISGLSIFLNVKDAFGNESMSHSDILPQGTQISYQFFCKCAQFRVERSITENLFLQ